MRDILLGCGLGRHRDASLHHPRQGKPEQRGSREHDDRLRAAEFSCGGQEIADVLFAQIACQLVDLLAGSPHILGDGRRIGSDSVGKRLGRAGNARDRIGSRRLGTIRDVFGLRADRVANGAPDAGCLLSHLFREATEASVVARSAFGACF